MRKVAAYILCIGMMICLSQPLLAQVIPFPKQRTGDGRWECNHDPASPIGKPAGYLDHEAGTQGAAPDGFTVSFESLPGEPGTPPFVIFEQGPVTEDFIATDSVSPEPAPVPEPISLMLFGVGLIGLGSLSRRKKKP